MHIVIEIPEEKYDVIESDLYGTFPAEMKEWGLEAIRNGTPLPKGHGRLIDADVLKISINKELLINERDLDYDVNPVDAVRETLELINDAPTITEAEKEYEAEVITRGKCMMCGKELTEGLFFCKECEDKANSRR